MSGKPTAPRADECGGTCVDTQSHPGHCGACGRACTGIQFCESGECVRDGVRCGSGCPCAEGEICQGGFCRSGYG